MDYWDKALSDAGLMTSDNRDFIHSFELPRIIRIHAMLTSNRSPQRILDIGYLDGLVPFMLLTLQSTREIVSTERPEIVGKLNPLPEIVGAHQLTALNLTEPPECIEGSPFDAVVCGEVLEHLPVTAAPGAIAFFRRVLRPGGLLIVTTPNLHGLRYRLRHAIGADFLHDPVPHPTMGMGHVTLYSARLLSDLAAQAGFSTNAIETHAFTGARRGGPLHALTRVVPSLGDDLIACFKAEECPQPTSRIFGRSNAGLIETWRASRRH